MIRRVLLGAAVGLILAAGARASAPLPSFYGCPEMGSAVRPQTIVVACGDGHYSLERVIWSRWTAKSAVGKGAAHVNDCTPDCSSGQFHLYRGVRVRLTRPRSCSDHKRHFTRIGLRYLHRKPAGIPRHSIEKVPFVQVPHCP